MGCLGSIRTKKPFFESLQKQKSWESVVGLVLGFPRAVLSHVPFRILTGCPCPSCPLARFLACPIVPLSRDNEGTSVPLSRKVSLSRPVGNPSSYVLVSRFDVYVLLNLICYKIDWHVLYSISCIGGIKNPSGATSRKCWGVITEMRYGFNIFDWNYRSTEDRKYFILQRISPFLGLQQTVKKWNMN